MKRLLGERAPQGGGELDQVDDRAPARRGRRRRGGVHRARAPRPGLAADHQPAHARTRSATSTTCRTRRARCRSASRCRTRSASAAPTAPWFSRAFERARSLRLELAPSRPLAVAIVALHAAAGAAAARRCPAGRAALLAAALLALGLAAAWSRALLRSPRSVRAHRTRTGDGAAARAGERRSASPPSAAARHVSRFMVTLAVAAPGAPHHPGHRATCSARDAFRAPAPLGALGQAARRGGGNNCRPDRRPCASVELFQSACVCGT